MGDSTPRRSTNSALCCATCRAIIRTRRPTKPCVKRSQALSIRFFIWLFRPPTSEWSSSSLENRAAATGRASLSKNPSAAMGILPGNSTAFCSELLKNGLSSVWTISWARVQCRIFFQPVDDAENAVFNQRHLKVDEQAQSLVGQPEIGQKLLSVDWGEKFDRLHFHNHLVLDDQVDAEAGVDADILVDHRDRLLPQGPETSTVQFVSQHRIVNGFQ